jgi:endonuclease G
MKYIIFIITLLIGSLANANPINDQCNEHVHESGAPASAITNSQYVCHLNYAVHFRFDTKVAEYVVYRIDPKDISGTVARKDNFKPDPSIDSNLNVRLEDYADSGYDRGHLSPAADNSADAEQMSQSFYLSNMAPQNSSQNRGSWRILEDRIRSIAHEGKVLYVTVGTVYEPGYKVIGNGVGVPQYLWKVVVDAETNNAIGFVFPNEPLPTSSLPSTITTIKRIEEMTGLNFHPNIEDNSFEAVEPDMQFWNKIN